MSVGNNKFSHELQTSKRFRLTEQLISLDALGAWNPDATDASRSPRDFAEMRNYRKMRPNEVETRSGYKQWRFPAIPIEQEEVVIGATTPTRMLGRAEYRLNDVFVDVTLFVATETKLGSTPHDWLYALIVYPSEEGVNSVHVGQTPSQADLNNDKTVFWQYLKICPLFSGQTNSTNPIAAAKQFGTYLVVSMIARDLADPADCGLFALSPATGDPSLQQAWTVTTLGKSVSPCPKQVTFPAKIQGDLLAVPTAGGDPRQSGEPVFVPKTDPATNLPVTVPLKINADYFLIASGITYPVEPLWEYGKRDTPVQEPVTGILHTMNRGWMYRVVVKKKFTDSRGQEHILSEAPSADFYVPDMIYGPACLAVTLKDTTIATVDHVTSLASSGGLPDGTRYIYPGQVSHGSDGLKNPTLCPSAQDYANLERKIQTLFPNSLSVGDALYFLLGYFAFEQDYASPTSFADAINYQNGQPPYLLNATSHQVSNAPNAIFNWADFGITDTDIYAIDIYRTTYTLPDESKDLAAGLPYQPYNHGFVGTLYKADGTYTDNISDANLLLSQSPLDAEGFLSGEIAGEVLQTYQGSLVIGNTRSKYRVRAPWPGAQAFLFTAASGSHGFSPSPAFDKNPNVPSTVTGYNTMWYYAYQDQDGVLSNAAPLAYWNNPDSLFGYTMPPPAPINAVFVLPRGYSTSVTSAVIFRAQPQDPTQAPSATNPMLLYRETTVALADGIYISDNTATLTLVGSYTPSADGTLPTGTFTPSDDPGSIFWSESGDAWSWPQSNYELETDQDPIKGMDSEIGPLYIFSDKGVVMTRLNGYQEPVHTSGTGAGCISRFGLVKIDADLYSLASSGLTRIDGSGSFGFPANIHSQIWARLQEKIPPKGSTGFAPFAGVRDLVCLSYLPKRGELFITFPSTVEMGGSMPAATFIVKQLTDTLPDNPYRDEIVRKFAYQFDLAVPVAPTPQTIPAMPRVPVGDSPAPTNALVLHLPHADGGMWSAWIDAGDQTNPDPSLRRNLALVVQDNDRPELPWLGQGSLQWQCSFEEGSSSRSPGAAGVQKRLDGIRFNAEALCDLFLVRGMIRTDGLADPLKNTLRPECQARQLAIQGLPAFPNYHYPGDLTHPENTTEYLIPIAHDNAIEAVGTPPAVRLVTRCVTNELSPLFNQHMLRMQSLTVWYDMDHYHKP